MNPGIHGYSLVHRRILRFIFPEAEGAQSEPAVMVAKIASRVTPFCPLPDVPRPTTVA
jgi:hypothetical protein